MSEPSTGIHFGVGFNSTVSPKLKNVVSLLRPAKPGDPLPPNFEPGPKDVCSGRGKRNWNHAGNIAFRNLIQANVESYINAPNKNEKTAIVCTIVDDMRRDGYRFLLQNKEGLWYDMGDAKARDKVGHSLRDQVTAINKGQTTLKPSNELLSGGLGALSAPLKGHWGGTALMQQMQELYEEDHHTLALSDNEAEAKESYRRRSNTSKEIEKFARRPSWIAGEMSSSSESMEGISAMELERERRRSSAWSLLCPVERTFIQDLMDMDASTSHGAGDPAQPHAGGALLPENVVSVGPTSNEYDYNYQPQPQHTVAAMSPTMVSLEDWSPEFQQQPTQQQQQQHGYSSQGSHPSSAGSAPRLSSRSSGAAQPMALVSTESQVNNSLTEEVRPYGEDAEAKQTRLPKRFSSGYTRNVLMGSIQSWDPRASQNSWVGSAHLSDVANSGNSFQSPLDSQRGPSRRLSGATLRRATNTMRFSEISIASDLMEELYDWGEREDGDDDVEI